MPERPQYPPPDRMIRELQGSDYTLGFFRELVSRTSPRYQALNPIKRGVLYSAGLGADPQIVTAFPALYFCRETVPIGSNTVAGMTQSDWCIWEWSSVPDAEDAENSIVTYSGDAIANPVYVRVNRVRRSTYEANPTQTPGTATLTGLIGIKVTAAGSNYTSAPTVAISGSLGAAATAVLNASGGVSHVIVTAEGSGYDSASLPTISFSGGGGSGATATAIVQPKTAVLTSQRKEEYPDGSPFQAEFVKLVTTWEVLPGPQLPYTRFDDDLGAVQGYRQAVLWTSQAATVTATGKTTYEARDGSSIVAWKVVESWSDGTGGAGNPAYPLGITDFYDDERGPVHQVSKIVADTTSVGSLAVSGGTVTQIRYEPFWQNPYLRKKITETWAVPGPTIKDRERYDENLGKVTSTRQLVENTSPAQAISSSGTTRYEASKYGAAVIWKILESWDTAAFPTLGPTTVEDDERGTVKITTQYVVKAGTETSTVTVAAGVATYTHYVKTDNPSLLQKVVEVSSSVIYRKGMTGGFGGSETLITTTISTTELYLDLPDRGTIDSKVRTFANGWIKTTVNIDGADWPILYDYDIDPETGQTILTSYQVIDPGAATSASSVAGVVTRYKHIDAWRSLEIIATYSDPADYDEQRFGAQNFPALLDITTWLYNDGCGTMVEEFRGGFSAMVEIRVAISYTTTKQTISGLTLIPKSFILGKYVQLPADVLIDAASIVTSGDCISSFSFTGSDPDYSTYIGSIQGTEQLITGESVRTQSGLYRNTKVYVQML